MLTHDSSPTLTRRGALGAFAPKKSPETFVSGLRGMEHTFDQHCKL